MTKIDLENRIKELELELDNLKSSVIATKQENKTLLLKIAENYPNSFVTIIEKDFTIGFSAGQEFINQNLNPKDFIGLTLEQVFGDKTHVVEEYYKNTFNGKEQSFELFINEQYQQYRTVPLYDNEESVAQILVVVENITKRKQVEKSLHSSQEMLLSSQSVANICSYSTDLIVTEIDKSHWECSPEFYKIFGIDETYPHTIEGWIGFLHPDYREDVAAYHESVVLEKKSFNLEYKIVRINDGVERWVHGTGELVYDEKGNPIRMHGAIQDITERKQVELALNESENKFKTLFKENNSVQLLITPSTGNIIDANQAACDFYGYAYEKLTTLSIQDINQYSEEEVKREMDSAKEKKRNYFEFAHKLKDGTIREVEVFSNPITIDNVQYLISIIHDITTKKIAERELIEAKEKAEESDRLKSAFLTNMSHEIRTPMNGILGFTELLKEPNLSSEEQQSFIEVIQRSGDRMLSTINDIVDISKIESGLMNVNIQETDINQKIEFACKFFKPEFESKGLQFLFKNGLSSVESKIKTDDEKVDGILTNLIKNAIKFTNNGSIEFGYDKKGEYLEFFVKDTGVGIPKHHQQLIFDRFRQSNESDNRVYEGSGLGLSISKSYVEMLGGKMWLESEEGKGSAFYFTIPYNPVSEEKIETLNTDSEEHKKGQIKNLKILIVEDDEISDSLLTKNLRKISKEILHASTGSEAVIACRNNPDIDLVLMDIRMPVMNGLEATRQIRQFNKDVIIVAQTAFALADDREKALESGCNDYISKPIDMTLLKLLIKKHVKN